MIFAFHPALLLLPTFLALAQSWTFSTTNINLNYPPPANSGISAENDAPVGPQSVFPCASIPVNPSQARVPFPVMGAFTYTLANTSIGSLADYNYNINSYIGQISLGNGAYTTASQVSSNNDNVGFAYLDTQVWKDFQSGLDCSQKFDYTAFVGEALGENVTAKDLVGLNATFGLRIVLFGEDPKYPNVGMQDYNQEEMYQCGYVTFTDDLSQTGQGGWCNMGEAIPSSTPLSPTATATFEGGFPGQASTLATSQYSGLTTVRTTELQAPTPVLPSTINTIAAVATSNSHPVIHTSSVAVGTGVGVSVGASVMILAVGFFFLRRRRARKAKHETISPLVLVSPPVSKEEMANLKKERKEKTKDAESSGSSVHSEPLPVYTEVMKE